LLFTFFRYKTKWYFIKAVTIAVSNLLLMFGLKIFFNRPRPLIPLLKELSGLSFPSGHAFMSLTFFGLIIYFVYRGVTNKWIKWSVIIFLIGIIFLVGLSRVYLRVHYASDVIAGFCFGILSLVLLFMMLNTVQKIHAKKDAIQIM
jgi:membrane-associated phospholipid phosphatase